jgi:hypothetical protein
MMKRFCTLISCLYLCCVSPLVAQTAVDMLGAFMRINDAFVPQGHALLAGQRLQDIGEGNSISSEKSSWTLFSTQGQLTRIAEHASYTYFLVTQRGYWLHNKKLRTPLKISGNYKVSAIEIQDIFRIDYATDYQAIRFEDIQKTVLMERTHKRMVYPYVRISRPERDSNATDTFEVCFMDRNQKPVRILRFIADSVDGYYCFKTIEVYNAVFEKTESARYSTEWIKRVSVPAALFNESNMIPLTAYMDTLLK